MFHKIKRALKLAYYWKKYHKLGVRWSSGVELGGFSTTFEGHNRLGRNTAFTGSLGRCSYMGADCKINADIGRYCSIAWEVCTISGRHPTSDWVSTSPVFFSKECQCGTSYVSEQLFDESSPKTVIGNDVWIGARAMILSGVKIGDGAIVAAGSVVTKDVEPYSIVGGVAAKLIRKRFTDKQIEYLMKLKWWEKDEAWIRDHADKFRNIEELIKGEKLDEGL